MNDRLPAGLEVAALMRRAEGDGGFATVVHRGDADRGAISLLIAERGAPKIVLERQMAADFTYRWREVANAISPDRQGWADWASRRSRLDPDCWLIELDIADAQRFIAETTASG